MWVLLIGRASCPTAPISTIGRGIPTECIYCIDCELSMPGGRWGDAVAPLLQVRTNSPGDARQIHRIV